MRRRIFASICGVALAALLVVSACVVGLNYAQESTDTWESLQAKAAYVAAGLQTQGEDYLQAVRGYTGRITLIAPDGTVLFDDREDAATMDNHADRPEVRQALETGTGRDQRKSQTLGTRTLYYAQRLPDGNVLRVAMGADSVFSEAMRFVPVLLVILVLLVLLAALVARRQTKAILAPVNDVDLDAPLRSSAYEELSPLLRRIAAQREQIDTQMKELWAQKREFEAITRNMAEGLLVVGRDGLVLTINESARRILGAEAPPEGDEGPRPVLAYNRNLQLDAAVRQAAVGERVEQVLELNGRKYRVVASPNRGGDGAPSGVVVLLMDDTERLEAEARRREFSANVSHELKTPLTSISGYAEIMKNGLVKPEDTVDFAGRIYDEASHLIALVEDILKLSRLDEKPASLVRERLALYALADRVAESLAPRAEQAGVRLDVDGNETLAVEGVPSILGEVVYNLIDNGIRYNRPGGSVDVRVARDGGDALLTVADTGIGIPPAHMDRVFERFYRVDKSHSRAGGGTGLGLSIVKRGVLFHEGEIDLASEPGKGSTFCIRLPAAD